jgi:hypothetical protein
MTKSLAMHGMSGARLAGAGAGALELKRRGGRYALATMCVGVGQGAALAIERARYNQVRNVVTFSERILFAHPDIDHLEYHVSLVARWVCHACSDLCLAFLAKLVIPITHPVRRRVAA